MKLYLDEDMASPLLAKLLRQEGHDVQTPTDVGLSGEDDPVHFRRAAVDERAIITAIYDDFKDLHLLVVDLEGHHPGVLIVRRDNNPKRDMNAAAIVRALRKLIAANAPISDECTVLNHWR